MIVDKDRYLADCKKAAEYIRGVVSSVPETLIVLGSGLGPLAEMCENPVVLKYADIPGFPVSTAPGHVGKLISGCLAGKNVFMMSGRFHYYEGYDISTIVFYIRVMKLLGVKNVILTNAAGGIMTDIEIPSLMVIEDHISFFAESVLRGPNLDEFGVRFPDQSQVYDKEFTRIMLECASDLGINVTHGIYAYTKGPQYETPAEIRALQVLGAKAVGMSTVPEAVAATHCGMRVVAVSCISNLAAGLSKTPLSGEEVIQNAGLISDASCRLIKEFVSRL